MSVPINAIVKYIKEVYKPYDISVRENNEYSPPIIELTLYFHKIDDKYIKNRAASSIIENKKANLGLEIRGDVGVLFSVKTIGVTLINDKFLSFNSEGELIINVETDEQEK